MAEHMQTSPDLGDANPMDTSRSFNMPLFSRPEDLAGLSDLGPSLAPVPFTGDVLMGFTRPVRTTPSNQLEQWYENNDGPWIPKGLAPPGEQDSMMMNNAAARNHAFVFAGPYRESISPSECDTLHTGIMPSDSGYGSKPSITTGSICHEDSLDQCTETQSLTGHLQGFNMGWSPPQAQPLTPQRPSQSTDGKERRCEHCNKVLKTNSELKKHKQRHIKPFVCEVPGCSRTAGFSTTNDLDRHKRSVHPAECVNGNRYRCPFGNCQKKDKLWPRADNFRAHVKRVHHQDLGEDDLEKYIHRLAPSQEVLTDFSAFQGMSTHFPPSWTQDMSTNSMMESSSDAHPDRPIHDAQMGVSHGTVLTGSMSRAGDQAREHNSYGERNVTMVDPSAAGQLEPSSGQLSPFSSHSPAPGSGQDLESQYVKPGDLGQRVTAYSYSPQAASITSNSDIKPVLMTPQAQDPDLGSFSESGAVGDEATSPSPSTPASEGIASSEGPDEKTPSAAEVSSLILKLGDTEKIREILETLQTSGLLRELGYRKESSPPSDEKGPESVASPRPDAHISCQTCHKHFVRRCELKKHMKRHERPYGCTFSDCNKRFGSKNDWKRHENSQHFLLEVWRCDVVDSDTPLEGCGKVIHRRETFRQHLVNNHQLKGPTVDMKLDQCRVGRNCEDRFWCGFCKEIIQIKQKGSHAWTERFDHIDDHYTGRNDLPRRQIDDWKSVDPDVPSVMDGSGTESENGDRQLAPAYNAPISSTASTSDMPRDAARVSGQKRTANGASDARHAKRTKNSGTVICCRCGEGNTRSVTPQCISGSCQHILCSNCV